jgi:uncharacterized protein DUF3500
MTRGVEGPAARDLTDAVARWLDRLDPRQRSAASFPFDVDERRVWAYTPGTRQGLALADMDVEQRVRAMGIVAAALSPRGAGEVDAIIALESILGALEREQGRTDWRRRDPGLFWFAVFGDPTNGGPWAWRIGGHHVAIQLAVLEERVIGSAPSFLGANPAVVPGGPSAGTRALTGEEALARELLANLSPAVRAIAVVVAAAPPDIHSGHGPRADLRQIPSGVRHADLDGAGRDRLQRLIRHYLERAAHPVAAAEWARIADAGLDEIAFAWAGPDEPGRGHYYAVRGPTFLIEYDNTQNGANHIHAVWRDLTNDWGDDVLAAHYRVGHRSTA